MKVAVISQMPEIDIAHWKRDVCNWTRRSNHEILLVFSRASLRDQISGAADKLLSTADRSAARVASVSGGDSSAGRRVPLPLPKSLATWGRQNGIEMVKTRKLSDPRCIEAMQRFGPDLSVLLGAEIVPAAVIDIPSRGTINSHFGLLPQYRGMNVAEWSIYNDDPVGVSVHQVDPGIDTGDILARETVTVGQGDSLESIRVRQRSVAARLLQRVIAEKDRGDASPLRQRLDEGQQFYRMHPVMRRTVERKLSDGTYRWLDEPARAETTNTMVPAAG